MLLVSLGLHGLLLALPLPNPRADLSADRGADGEASDSAPQATMDVVQLPASARPQSQSHPAPEPSFPAMADLAPPLQPFSQFSQPPEPAVPPIPTPRPLATPTPSSTPKPSSPNSSPSPPSPTPAPNPAPTPTDPRLDYGRYQYNHQTKSIDDANGAFSGVASALQLEYPSDRWPQIKKEYAVTLPIDYLLDTCLPQPPGTARLVAVVDPNGHLDRPPEWVASTGYDLLDQEALEAINQYQFPAPPTLAIYGVTVTVNYDAEHCVPPPE